VNSIYLLVGDFPLCFVGVIFGVRDDKTEGINGGGGEFGAVADDEEEEDDHNTDVIVDVIDDDDEDDANCFFNV
jgi:hypothetical protein